ncbi:MAG: serine hydrolase, partial [Chitinophagaceae bacterium]|nr:serine hydrolase [Chitinophagaceae bacterium]
MHKKVLSVFFLLLVAFFTVHAQPGKNNWVDSVFTTLNADEKIGQLFMIVIPAHAGSDVLEGIANDIKSHEVGGIIFQQETPFHQAAATQKFQRVSKIPLFVGQDAEWGLGQMIDSTISFPRPMILGAISNDSMIYEMGRETARQMKVMGLNLNFAPLADINNDPQDPMISYRSFGENKVNVADKAAAFTNGLQDHGVLACAKHFTVKGLTIVDISNNLPSIHASIDSVAAFPFKRLFENQVTGVMPASTTFPLFYDNAKLVKKNGFDASTLSLLFTGNWLKEKMDFKGLSFVDLSQIKLVTEKNREGDAEVLAFQAGNDILIGPQDIPQAIRKIKKLIKAENKYEEQLNVSVRKILAAKYKAGLFAKKEINLDNLTAKLTGSGAQLLKQKLYESSITVVRNTNNTLPIASLENKHFAFITSDETIPNQLFYSYLSKYVSAGYFTVNDKTDLLDLSDALTDQEVIIVGIFPQTPPSVIERLNRLLNQLAPSREIIYCDFGNETFLKSAENFSTVITAYTNTPETLKAVPQVIFGGLSASGRLPFTASAKLKEGAGVTTKSINRFVYSTPEDAHMNSRTLEQIERIADEAINTGATPGCQVFVARNGKVIYERSFGSLTYEKTNPVSSETLYDLASLTKVSATLQAMMFMYEKGLIDIYKKSQFRDALTQ